jgi:excisionase family DNA binding protein
MPIDPLVSPTHLLEPEHVAHRLGVSTETIRRLIRRRKLKATRLGRVWRVSEAQLAAYVASLPSNDDLAEQLAETG